MQTHKRTDKWIAPPVMHLPCSNLARYRTGGCVSTGSGRATAPGSIWGVLAVTNQQTSHTSVAARVWLTYQSDMSTESTLCKHLLGLVSSIVVVVVSSILVAIVVSSIVVRCSSCHAVMTHLTHLMNKQVYEQASQRKHYL